MGFAKRGIDAMIDDTFIMDYHGNRNASEHKDEKILSLCLTACELKSGANT